MRSLFSKSHDERSDNELREKVMRLARRIGGRKERVLIMDDDAVVRGVVRSILSDAGYDIRAAKNAVDAIDYFKDANEAGASFDAVLLDLNVHPGSGGDIVIGKLREMDPQVKAILMTADINHPAVTNYEILGFKSVVIKPFTRDDLLRALYDVSDNSPDAAEVIPEV